MPTIATPEAAVAHLQATAGRRFFRHEALPALEFALALVERGDFESAERILDQAVRLECGRMLVHTVPPTLPTERLGWDWVNAASLACATPQKRAQAANKLRRGIQYLGQSLADHAQYFAEQG